MTRLDKLSRTGFMMFMGFALAISACGGGGGGLRLGRWSGDIGKGHADRRCL